MLHPSRNKNGSPSLLFSEHFFYGGQSITTCQTQPQSPNHRRHAPSGVMRRILDGGSLLPRSVGLGPLVTSRGQAPHKCPGISGSSQMSQGSVSTSEDCPSDQVGQQSSDIPNKQTGIESQSDPQPNISSIISPVRSPQMVCPSSPHSRAP